MRCISCHFFILDGVVDSPLVTALSHIARLRECSWLEHRYIITKPVITAANRTIKDALEPVLFDQT